MKSKKAKDLPVELWVEISKYLTLRENWNLFRTVRKLWDFREGNPFRSALQERLEESAGKDGRIAPDLQSRQALALHLKAFIKTVKEEEFAPPIGGARHSRQYLDFIKLDAESAQKVSADDFQFLCVWKLDKQILQVLDLCLRHVNLYTNVYPDKNSKNRFSFDPSCCRNYSLDLVCKTGNTNLLSLLLHDTRIDPSADENYALRTASFYGHNNTVSLLLEDQRTDPSVRNNAAIRSAAENGHAVTVSLLLQDPRVDPSAYNNSAIRIASQNGHTSVVSVLLSDRSERVDPSALNNSAIRLASEFGHSAVVELLMADRRVDPFDIDASAVEKSASNGHEKVMELLLRDRRSLDLIPRHHQYRRLLESSLVEVR